MTVIDRPPELCQDDSTTNSVIAHFLSNYDVETFALVQATSPLLRYSYLKKGFEKFSQCSGVDTIISTYKTVDFYWSSDKKPLNFDPTAKKRTQEMQSWHVENGAFYITTKDNFLENKILQNGSVGFIEMNEWESIDVDYQSDLEMVKRLCNY